MAQSNPFIIGRGSEVTVALLPKGSRASIVEQTVTLGAAATAAATSLTVAALAEPLSASADSPIFLSFVDAVDETDRFVKVTAPAADAATSLTVAALKKAIAVASTAQYPVKLQARTSADINTNANDTTTTTFDSGGYEDGIVTQIGYGVSCPGNFLSLDAGFRTCFYAFNEFREVWLTLKLPKPEGYTNGYVFKGAAAVTNCPLTIPADGIVQANLEFKFRGKLDIVEPA